MIGHFGSVLGVEDGEGRKEGKKERRKEESYNFVSSPQ